MMLIMGEAVYACVGTWEISIFLSICCNPPTALKIVLKHKNDSIKIQVAD